MANRIQPHPNPPYHKSDGTLNASGQLRLYIAGTATPKIAHKDAAGTSYGSIIDLDASGLPDAGPIYWDATSLYKVEVYYPDGVGGYTLDYTVDSYGATSADAVDTITTATTWTVDFVGGSSTTFATLSAAMDAARRLVILGGSLTINISAGTLTNDAFDLYHPQGEKIYIVGAGSASTNIVVDNSTDAVISMVDGSKLGELASLTISTDISNGKGVVIGGRATLVSFHDCIVATSGGVGLVGVLVGLGGYVGAYNITIKDFTVYGLSITTEGIWNCSSDCIIDDSATGGLTAAIAVSGKGANFTATELTIIGNSGSKITTGVSVDKFGYVGVANELSISNATTGIVADLGGIMYVGDTTPTFTTVGTNYSPATVDTWNTGTTSIVGTLIYTA